jgi:hypothetical protein
MADHQRLSLKNLSWLCQEAMANIETLPDDKAGRWIGFIGGCLAMRGLINAGAPDRDLLAPAGDMTILQNAHRVFFERYLSVMNSINMDETDKNPALSIETLKRVCRDTADRITSIPDALAGRSLGFVQGCLAMRGHICVDEERAASRPYFHEAYKAAGAAIPKTYARND